MSEAKTEGPVLPEDDTADAIEEGAGFLDMAEGDRKMLRAISSYVESVSAIEFPEGPVSKSCNQSLKAAMDRAARIFWSDFPERENLPLAPRGDE
jgi:hypothetical protein